jgi:RNA polymerase sigma-70 factor (ECF subfamily)
MPFQTTNWTLVVQAAGGDSTGAREALAALCGAYWYPVYAFIRRQGYPSADAEDLTQGYFTRFIEKQYVKDLKPEAGRFRAFVLASVRHFLSNERDRERAEKRGGGRPSVALDAASAEERYALEPVDPVTPESLFERAWATSVLDRALARLANEAARGDEVGRFDELKAHLTGGDDPSTYRDLAEAWGVGESAVRVSVHRMRKRFGRLLREEVAATVADPTEVDAELRYLLAMLGGPV